MRVHVQLLPVVSTNNPVWVEHWNELEHKHVSKGVSTWVVFSQDKVEETVEHKGRGSLPGVHSTAEKKHLQTHVDRQGRRVSFTDWTLFSYSRRPYMSSLKPIKVSHNKEDIDCVFVCD